MHDSRGGENLQTIDSVTNVMMFVLVSGGFRFSSFFLGARQKLRVWEGMCEGVRGRQWACGPVPTAVRVCVPSVCLLTVPPSVLSSFRTEPSSVLAGSCCRCRAKKNEPLT